MCNRLSQKFSDSLFFYVKKNCILNKKKKSLGNACIKDFTFHTAHILHTVGDVLMEELGNDGAMAVSLARSDYSDMFGKDALDCLDGIF